MMSSKSELIVKDVCAWPNLIRLADDQIGAVIFNRPYHGTGEGSLDFWRMDTQSSAWKYTSTPCPGPTGQNRMHCACGVREDGTIDLLSTGFRVTAGRFVKLESMWHSQSVDCGKSWQINKNINLNGVDVPCVPYGAVFSSRGALFASVYRGRQGDSFGNTWLIQSDDGGRSWFKHSRIGEGGTTEAYVVKAGENMLAAVRTYSDHLTKLYTAKCDYNVWYDRGPLTMPLQHPAHLLSIEEKCLLLTYGIRNRGLMGIGGRVSLDKGKNWGAPFVLHQFPSDATDCGYPSTLLFEKDSLITGYYTNVSREYRGYQFGIIRWKLSDYTSPWQLESIVNGEKLII